MARLNATAKAALRDAGVSQAAWARANYMRDGKWSGDQCGCPDDRCANGFHHFGPDDCGCLPVLIGQYFEWLRGADAGMFDKEAYEYVNRVVVKSGESGRAPVSAGPYETEREAAHAARALGGPLRDGRSILSSEQNRQLLTDACAAAGVELGAFDERILAWLAGFEDSTCAVLAGLITRAAERRGAA